MNNSNNLRSRVEAAIERANLGDAGGEDLASAFETRLDALEKDLRQHRDRSSRLERENRDLNELLVQLLDAVEQNRFGDFLKSASNRLDSIAGSLDAAPPMELDMNAGQTDGADRSPHDASDSMAPPKRKKSPYRKPTGNLTLVSDQMGEQDVPRSDEAIDDDVAVMEVVERLSNLTHELAETESTA